MIDKESLIVSMVELGAVRFGEFELREDTRSPLYVDLQMLASRPATLRRTARIMQRMAQGLRFDRIAAIPMGGLPFGMALSFTTDKPLLYPRPPRRDGPNSRYIAGSYNAGETVLLVDDLIAHGTTKLDAIRLLETVRLKVTDVMVLLDRGLGGRERLEAQGYRVHPILTVPEILDTLLRIRRITAEQHRFISAWVEVNEAGKHEISPVD